MAAHRGSSHEFPANTIASFARALDIHAGALLEMDVWETRDGHAVVMHDGMVECATDGRGCVDSLTLEELQRLDAGFTASFDGGTTHPFRGKGYQIPSLDEVLKAFPHVPKSIDIKYHRPGFARRVMALIESRGEIDNVIMGSFNAKMVRLIRREYPAAATCVTTPGLLVFLLMQTLGMSRLCPIRGDAFSIPEFAGGEAFRGSGLRKDAGCPHHHPFLCRCGPSPGTSCLCLDHQQGGEHAPPHQMGSGRHYYRQDRCAEVCD